jgi:hypothetical protein
MTLSVIIAAPDSGPALKECVAAMVSQLLPSEMEVLVVDGAGSKQEFPSVRTIRCPEYTSVPHLWRAGIEASRGKIIALTIENCVPAPDWARRMLRAHQAECSAVGGAIEIAPRVSLVDWAVYFSRYSSYMPPFTPHFPDDLAGDNSSYKREAIDTVKPLMADGFWETFINRDIRRRDQQLLCDPGPVVTYSGGLSARRFFVRRLTHGRYFAARRSLEFTGAQRLARAMGSLVVPPLILKRIAGRVWRNGRHRGRFLATLPLVASFSVAWAVGEGLGYLAGPSGARPPLRE